MFLRVPFTDIYVNEFGTVRYTGWKGESREDQGFKNKCKYMMIKTQSCFMVFAPRDTKIAIKRKVFLRFLLPEVAK